MLHRSGNRLVCVLRFRYPFLCLSFQWQVWIHVTKLDGISGSQHGGNFRILLARSHGFSYNTNLAADPDGDGVNFLMAYALGLDPREIRAAACQPDISGNQLSLVYAGREVVTYKVETSEIWRTGATRAWFYQLPMAKDTARPGTGRRHQSLHAAFGQLLNRT